MLQAQQMRQMKVISSTNKDFWSEQKIKICNSSVMTTNVMLRHPAERSENTSICAKIRKYVPIDCLWQMFS